MQSTLASSLIDGVDDVAASLFDFFELEKVPLLGFEQLKKDERNKRDVY